MGKIYAISDLHGQLPRIPSDATSLIVVGDICPDYVTQGFDRDYQIKIHKGEQQQKVWLGYEFRNWAEAAGIPIYATFGNHDFIGEYPFLWPEIDNVTFTINNCEFVEGYKVWFYPYTPRLSGWALKAEPPESDALLAKVQPGMDILATHGPPFGAGDKIPRSSRFNGGRDALRVGDEALNRAIPRIDPQVVICGHIHEGRGEEKLPGSDHVIVNVAAMDDNYRLYPEPFVDLTPYLVAPSQKDEAADAR